MFTDQKNTAMPASVVRMQKIAAANAAVTVTKTNKKRTDALH